MTSRVNRGVSSAIDLRQSEALEAEAAAVDPRRRSRRIQEQENLLQFLMAKNPGPVERGARRSASSFSAPVVPAGLPSALLERRPDIRLAEQTMRAENARVGEAKALLYPQISLTGSRRPPERGARATSSARTPASGRSRSASSSPSSTQAGWTRTSRPSSRAAGRPSSTTRNTVQAGLPRGRRRAHPRPEVARVPRSGRAPGRRHDGCARSSRRPATKAASRRTSRCSTRIARSSTPSFSSRRPASRELHRDRRPVPGARRAAGSPRIRAAFGLCLRVAVRAAMR